MSIRRLGQGLRRKGQMEAAGLVVIVILLSLGMLFMAQFALKSDTAKKVFVRKGLAYSSLTAIAKTTIHDPLCVSQLRGEVYPQVEKDILEDCALYTETSPDGYSLYRCNNQHSCVFLQEQIAAFLEDTLWFRKYEFSATILDGEKVLVEVKKDNGCPPRKERDAANAFINTDAGLVESVLYVCE